MSYMLEGLLEILLVVVGAFGFVFLVVIAPAIALDSYQCGKYQKMTGKETRYEALTCYVETKRGFMPYSELQYREVTNE